MTTPMLVKDGKLTGEGQRLAAWLQSNVEALRKAKHIGANFYAQTVLSESTLLTPVQFMDEYYGFAEDLYESYLEVEQFEGVNLHTSPLLVEEDKITEVGSALVDLLEAIQESDDRPEEVPESVRLYEMLQMTEAGGRQAIS